MVYLTKTAYLCISAVALGMVSNYRYDSSHSQETFELQGFAVAGDQTAPTDKQEITAPKEESAVFWDTCSEGKETLDCLLAGCATVTDMEKWDCEALVALYNATNGSTWTQKTDWLLTNKACSWFGVVCNGNKRVTYLRLQSNNLAGNIPDAFWNLTELMQLNMSNNLLSWPIPSTLGNLKKAQWFLLNGNNLMGKIPATLWNLQNVKRFRLFENDLEGNIPKELWTLTQIQDLLLSDNALSWPLPNELGKLKGMKKFWIDGNQLTWPIPSFLSSWSQLQDIDLSHNLFCGYLPPSFMTTRPNGLPFSYDWANNNLMPKWINKTMQEWITKNKVLFWTQNSTKCPMTQEQQLPLPTEN